ncbi:hypothetical protein EGT49_02245 [Companilactobacillus suantsaicola]|uniref:SCP domain-containing protein n=1 Tax=Companilactobacillus suantsaicola TaxID=2487723 RepID=A0A4Z0JNL4_9LACO|nr:MucBP domain-containing protein [Companilactobacillus suantsaicola]TGD24591.1 hypothetical protein EGT49_02245 [Companilactobacillus suantsaicola]
MFTYTKDAVAPKTATVTTKFVDENDKEIAKSTTSEANIGDSYPAKAIDVDGYTVKGDATQNVTVDGDKTVTFTYTKDAPVVEKANVTVNYVDSKGKKLKESKTLTDKEVGQDVTEPAIAIDGYTVDQQGKTLTVAKDNNVITFTYSKDVSASIDTTEVANKIISLVNEYRQQNGLNTLNTDVNLTAGAVARANTEADHVNSTGKMNAANHDEFIAQTQPDLNRYDSSDMAENLAINGGSTADELAKALVDQWKASPDHNATMLDKSMTDIGVGVKQLDSGSYVAIQDFGGKQNESACDSTKNNSAYIGDLGYTYQDLLNSAALQTDAPGRDTPVAELVKSDRTYISNRVFKKKSDANTWLSTKHNEGSIWDEGYGSGYFLAYDNNGKPIGYVPYVFSLSKPASELIAEGKTTWTTDYVIPQGQKTSIKINYLLSTNDRTGFISYEFLPSKTIEGLSGDKVKLTAPEISGYRLDERAFGDGKNNIEVTLDKDNDDYNFVYISNDVPIVNYD